MSEQITRVLYYDFIKSKTDQNDEFKINYDNYLKQIKMKNVNSRLKRRGIFCLIILS